LHRIAGTPFLARLFSGGAWALAGRIVSAFVALLVAALLARLMSPDAVGTYFLIANTVVVCASTALLGANQVVVRLVASRIEKKDSATASLAISSGVLLAAIGLLTVATCFGFWLGPWLGERVFRSPLFVNAAALGAAWIAATGAQLFQADVFRGFHSIREATVFGGLLSTCILACLLAIFRVLIGTADSEGVVAAATASTLVSVAIAFSLLRPNATRWRMPDAPSMLHFVHIAWPIGLTSVGLLVLSHVDLLILGAHAKPAEVSIYGMATRLAGFLALPLLIANAALPPLIAEYHSRGATRELSHGLRSAAGLATVCSVAMFLVMVMFGRELLSLLYGSYFVAGYYVLLIVSMGQLVNVWAGSCGMTLLMTGNQKAMMTITMVSAVFAAGGAWMLAPRFGGIGVAVIQCLALTLQNVLMLVMVKKRCGFWTHAAIGVPRT
jgi:O-antigen/teichoic acid export membrane protein